MEICRWRLNYTFRRDGGWSRESWVCQGVGQVMGFKAKGGSVVVRAMAQEVFAGHEIAGVELEGGLRRAVSEGFV